MLTETITIYPDDDPYEVARKFQRALQKLGIRCEDTETVESLQLEAAKEASWNSSSL